MTDTMSSRNKKKKKKEQKGYFKTNPQLQWERYSFIKQI